MLFALAVVGLVVFMYRRDLRWSLGALGLLAVTSESVCQLPSAVQEVFSLLGLALIALGSALIVRELRKDPIARRNIRDL